MTGMLEVEMAGAEGKGQEGVDAKFPRPIVLVP